MKLLRRRRTLGSPPAQLLRPETLNDAVSLLALAETIYLIGQRRSFPVTAYLNYLFGKLGVRTVLIGFRSGNDPKTLSFATPTDAAIAVSFTPYGSSTVNVTQHITDGGTSLVVVTASPFSPLLSLATCRFEAVEEDFEGLRFLSATPALSMALAVGIAERRRAE